MVKLIEIGGKKIKFKATAATPRIYRMLLSRDIFADYSLLYGENNGEFNAEQLTIFENMAFVMAKQADDTVPDTADEWLDTIEGVFSIYNIFPHILELWNGNTETQSKSKKKVD